MEVYDVLTNKSFDPDFMSRIIWVDDQCHQIDHLDTITHIYQYIDEQYPYFKSHYYICDYNDCFSIFARGSHTEHPLPYSLQVIVPDKYSPLYTERLLLTPVHELSKQIQTWDYDMINLTMQKYIDVCETSAQINLLGERWKELATIPELHEYLLMWIVKTLTEKTSLLDPKQEATLQFWIKHFINTSLHGE
jgi:hypothetical protein